MDRIFLSKQLTDSCQIIGDKDILDHAPIWLKFNAKDWGPKPFRVNNFWFEHKYFKSFVEKEWKALVIEGKQAYVLKERFKVLRSKLRSWIKECFGWVYLKVEKVVQRLIERDRETDEDVQGVINNNDFSRAEIKDEIWKNMYLKKCLLKQKS